MAALRLWIIFALLTTIRESFGAKERIIFKDPYATVPQIISSEGYPVERHRVRTSDGYNLQLHRIPAGRRAVRRVPTGGKGKSAVLLVHGLLGSSGDFVLLGRDRSLAFMLADSGYDVWLGNMRGTEYSSHSSISKDDAKFWNFSFEQHGLYDVPAFIDKVLNVTGQKRLVYIGHSMGTTSMFITLSQRCDYNDKVAGFIALAPAVYMDNLRSFIRMVTDNGRLLEDLRARGVGSINMPRSMRNLMMSLCRPRSEDNVCLQLISSVVGGDVAQVDWRTLPIFIARSQPAGLGQLEHFSKVAASGEFIQWGGGVSDMSAPLYNLTAITAPVQIYFGENDQLTTKSDVMRLAQELNLPDESIHSVPWKKFNHLDFIFAKDLDKLLNRDIIERVDSMCADINDVAIE